MCSALVLAHSIRDNFDAFLKHYEADPKSATELISVGQYGNDESLNNASLAAWTMVCNQLMNLDEVLNK